MGTYDEEASAKSFQDALREWRNESEPTVPTQKKDLWVNPADEHVPIGNFLRYVCYLNACFFSFLPLQLVKL